MTAGAERSPGALFRFACVGAAAAGVYGFRSPEKGSVREQAFPRGMLCSGLAWMIIAISGTLSILFLLYAFLLRIGTLCFFAVSPADPGVLLLVAGFGRMGDCINTGISG